MPDPGNRGRINEGTRLLGSEIPSLLTLPQGVKPGRTLA